MISIRQLRYFSAVAQTGHFGLAAEQCAVTQPALSMQIQDLEKELGLQLLERGRKGVSLTPGGREIAERAARLLADVTDLIDSARQLAGTFSGTLRFGAIPSIAPYLLPQLLPLIRAAHPDLDLQLRETQTQKLLEELVDGQLDVVLLALPVEHPGIEAMPLFDDRFLLALPASRKVGSRVRATPDLLRNDRLLLLEEGHCLRDQALAFCSLRKVESIDMFGASSLSTIVQMVANGLGLTLLPELSLALETKRADIRVMHFADPEPKRVVGLAWRETSPRKRDFAALGALIVEAANRD
ncbi:MAG TPA: LysR substrate-binding domain-containing protein [Hyphomicrobiaceae bacterium]|nr:LysR substrate-binding domain-containing protein [Hyphomicrobiaceae bacterium]